MWKAVVVGEEKKQHDTQAGSISLLIIGAEDGGSLFIGGLTGFMTSDAHFGHRTVVSCEGNLHSHQPPAMKLVIPCDMSWQNDFVWCSEEVGKEEMSEMFLILGNLFGV